MQRDVIYDAWIPAGGPWSLWAKPVCLADIGDLSLATLPTSAVPDIDLSWVPLADCQTVLILDLPGPDAVETGVALAKVGYRPVPLFNGCSGRDEAIDQAGIRKLLIQRAQLLDTAGLATDAPPVFLLDANRMNPGRDLRVGVFDNRWTIYADDFPSVARLLQCGYRRALLLQQWHDPMVDIADVLYGWQAQGMEVKLLAPFRQTGRELRNLLRPPWWKRWWHGLKSFGFRRRHDGSYGGVIEQTHG